MSLKISSNGHVECVFVMIDTCKKNFSQKLKGQNFKVPYNLHRGCFQKNVNR